MQPGLEHLLDVSASSGVREAALNPTFRDDDQGWNLVDAESRRKSWTISDLDVMDDEGVVITSPLKHLGQEALDPSTSTVDLRVEEDETRPCLSGLLGRAELLSRVGDAVDPARHEHCRSVRHPAAGRGFVTAVARLDGRAARRIP